MQILQKNSLIDEQKTNEPNPLYALAEKKTRHTIRHPHGLSTRQSCAIATSTNG